MGIINIHLKQVQLIDQKPSSKPWDAVRARGKQKSEVRRVCNRVGEIQSGFSLPEDGKVTEGRSHTGGASSVCGGIGTHVGLWGTLHVDRCGHDDRGTADRKLSPNPPTSFLTKPYSSAPFLTPKPWSATYWERQKPQVCVYWFMQALHSFSYALRA